MQRANTTDDTTIRFPTAAMLVSLLIFFVGSALGAAYVLLGAVRQVARWSSRLLSFPVQRVVQKLTPRSSRRGSRQG